MTDLIALVLSFSYIFVLAGVTELLRRSGRIEFDLSRKILHIGVGTWVIPTVLLFQSAYWAAIPPALATIFNAVSHRMKLVKAMDEESGDNLGTTLFPLSFLILILALWNQPDGKAALTAGILVLAWGDAAAALIGRRWGRHRYRVGSSWRTYEGSAAMLVFSVLAILVAGFVVRDQPYGAPWVLIGAFLATGLEAGSRWGMDNLLVPIGTSFVLWGLG